MTPEVTTVLVAMGVIAVLVIGGTYWWLNRTRGVPSGTDDVLPLFGGVDADDDRPTVARPPAHAEAVRDAGATSRGRRERRTAGRPESGDIRPSPLAPLSPPSPLAESVARAPQVPPAERPRTIIREFTTGAPSAPAYAPSAAIRGGAMGMVSDGEAVPGVVVEGHALRYSVPAEGTLQFLPGRLEITAGLDKGREIRLVRLEGPDGVEVTFGRADGPRYRHVQLREKTVSRRHARMYFSDGAWTLESLSRTNPVVLDGQPMAEFDRRPLADGAVIEMGEVVFTFRGR